MKRTLMLLLCGLGTVTCSRSPAGPTAPSDLSGTWVGDGGRTWTLTASAAPSGQASLIQVGGNATMSQNAHPIFGAMSARGGMLGTIVVGLGGLHFAETYESVSTPLFPFPPNDCYIETEGQLTVSGSTMTGVVTEHDGCNGVRLRDATAPLTMRR